MSDGGNGVSPAEMGLTQKDLGIKPENLEKVDALVVLGKGYNHRKKERASDPLSERSKWNVIAAAELYNRGIADKLILSGGRTAKGMPGEAEAMRTYLMREYPNIPPEVILTENQSIDTVTNAQKIKEELEAVRVSKIALVTTQDHAKNSEKLFKNHGIPITRTYSSEDIVRGVSPIHSRNIDRYMRSWRNRYWVRPREAARGVWLKVDPKGRAVNWAVRKFTSRARK